MSVCECDECERLCREGEVGCAVPSGAGMSAESLGAASRLPALSPFGLRGVRHPPMRHSGAINDRECSGASQIGHNDPETQDWTFFISSSIITCNEVLCNSNKEYYR